MRFIQALFLITFIGMLLVGLPQRIEACRDRTTAARQRIEAILARFPELRNEYMRVPVNNQPVNPSQNTVPSQNGNQNQVIPSPQQPVIQPQTNPQGQAQQQATPIVVPAVISS